MILKIYKTDFKPEANGVYEGLQEFLNSQEGMVFDYKYIQPALTVRIKLPVPSHIKYKSSIGNYVDAIDDDNRHYYYFVMNYDWKGSDTLELELALDTLNTYWGDFTFTKNTHITRKYKQRFNISDDNTSAYPVVDNTAEQINTPPMKNKSASVVGDTEHWYLIYKTQYDDKTDLNKNPVLCLCLPETEKETNIGYVSSPINYTDLNSNFWYLLSPNTNIGAIVKCEDVEMRITENHIVWFYSTGSSLVVTYQYITDPKVIVRTITTTAGLTITGTNFYYQQSGDKPTKDYDLKDARYNNPIAVSFGSDSDHAKLRSFKAWYEENKVNPTNIKIQELAYAPFTLSYDTNNRLNKPDGWKWDNGCFVLDGATDFKNNIAQTVFPTTTKLQKSDINTNDIPKTKYETKLWNSSYSYAKYVYDNQYYVPHPEMLINPSNTTLNITYNFSTGMDNSSSFEFNANAYNQTDFENFIVSNRSVEIPYYTNEYLNYLRYGKAVDERKAGLSVASAAIGGVGAAASTAASLAFGFSSLTAGAATGGVAGAVVGAVVGLATTVVSTISAVNNATDTINSKIDAYTHQSSQTNSAGDLSIFKTYGKNKLLRIVYRPENELYQSIFNYFRLFGYATDEYDAPVFNTRYWSDYIVCDPDFVNNNIWHDFLDDIKTRMKLGFRVFHRNNGVYDLTNNYENWENSLITWSKS